MSALGERAAPGSEEADLLPRLERLASLARKLLAGEIGSSAASHARAGAGSLFTDHRAYAPGDDPRTIDWNAYARFEDHLFVRLFEPEDSAPITVVLDASASMQVEGGRKAQQAARLAAAFAAIGVLAQSGALVARVPSGDQASFRGKSTLLPMLRFVLRPPLSGSATLADAVRRGPASDRGGPLVLVTDAAPPGDLERALALRGRRPALVLQVVDPEESEPPHAGIARWIDPETGRQRTIRVSRGLRLRYLELLRARFRDVESAALRAGARFLRVSTASPFDAAIVEVLRRGLAPSAARR